MADCVCRLAHAVRQASHGRKLVLFFYGYVFEFGAVANGPATSGHYALRRVLELPGHRRALLADLLFRPRPGAERPGDDRRRERGPGRQDVALRGRHADLPGHRQRAGLDATPSIRWRRPTRSCCATRPNARLRNFGTWWMDLGATGWFNDRRMWAEMRRLAALDEPLLRQPRPFRPEVAAVIDEASMIRVAAGGQAATVPGVYEARRALGRMGAPYGQYLLDDVAAGRVRGQDVRLPDRLVALAGPAPAAPGRHARQPAGLVLRPGLSRDQHGASLDAMRELTGFRIKQVSGVQARAEPTALGRRLGLRSALRDRSAAGKPLFAAARRNAPTKPWRPTPTARPPSPCASAGGDRSLVRRPARAELRVAAVWPPDGQRAPVHAIRLQRLRQRALPGPACQPGRAAGDRHRAGPARSATCSPASRSATGRSCSCR